MQSNAIDKFDETRNNYKNTLKLYMPKMAIVDVKSVDSTANVINKVESKNNDLKLIHTLLIKIVVIMCANCFYNLHNKCLKKKYMSQANDLDKI